MVVPLGIGPNLQGAPPPELEREFKVIKFFVIMMMVGAVGKMLAGILGGLLFRLLFSSFNFLCATTCGIFLLREDKHIQPVYKFIRDTCCEACADTLGGGLSCLFPFVILNSINVFFDVFMPGGPLTAILSCITIINDQPEMFQQAPIYFVLLVSSFIACFLGQLGSAIFGYRAWKQMIASPALRQGPPQGPPPGQAWGGGRMGPGGGYNPPPFRPSSGGPSVGAGPAAASRAPLQQTFQPFSGQGNRLGT